MASARTLSAAFLAMLAFAGNSLLCRAALGRTAIDPATFTILRLGSGAMATWALAGLRRREPAGPAGRGSWGSALALCVYAAAFSFAYRSLSASVGALLLFPAVQATMVGGGLRRGERLGPAQAAGLLLALGGLALLLWPGFARAHASGPVPSLSAALLMLASGTAWGVYSLRGRTGDPVRATAGNFLRAAPMALPLALAFRDRLALDAAGCLYALASGALASGLGYILWYRALGGLGAAASAGIQLSVPVLTALGGLLLFGEPLTGRMVLASAVILAGVALAMRFHTAEGGSRA